MALRQIRASDPAAGGHACSHSHAQAERGPAALAAAEQACSDKGLRLTTLRRQILAELYETHRPLGAYDLIDRLAAKGVRRLAPVSVYRALEFLIDQGFAHRLASRNAFMACPFGHAPGETVVFLICEECGGVDEAEAEGVKEALCLLARQERFAIRTPVIEVSGLCAHCGGRPRARLAAEPVAAQR
jgi:Fur family zinc uptake transcriptional regulator